MVTASCRIGYDFSTPDGPLTMKLAETPSRRAGLIISVFGVASSPMDSLLAQLGGGASVRGRGGRVKERTNRRRASRGDGELRGSTAGGRASASTSSLGWKGSSFDCEDRVSTARVDRPVTWVGRVPASPELGTGGK